MKNSEINRLRMFKAVLAFVKQSPTAILVLLPVLNLLMPALEALVNAMIAAEQTQGTVAVGAGSNKTAKKLVLLNAATSVGKALYSYANSKEDSVLGKLMQEMLEEMDKKADATFIMRCMTIHEKGVEHVGQLGPYGISDAVLTALELTINNYKGQEENVRNRIVERAYATTNIAVLQKETTELLKKQMDPAIESMPNNEDTMPYKTEYKRNRVIIDLGHRHTQFKGMTSSQGTQKPLSFVELEFRNEERTLKVKSGNDGKYKETLHPDIYDIIATHPDFEPFIISGVKIQAGEIKVTNIELVPKING